MTQHDLPSAPTAPIRILCVDDEANLLTILEHLLADAGFDVVTTTRPEEALRLAAKQRFSAAAVDYLMPGMTGDDLVQQLLEMQPHLRSIIFTGSSADLPQRVFSVADAVLSKSFPATTVAVLQHLTSAAWPERRRALRHRVSAQVRLQTPAGAPFDNAAVDLSLGGIGLSAPVAEPVGTQLQIAVRTFGGQLLIATTVEVRYTAAGRTGLSWVRVSDYESEQIVAFCAAAWRS